MKLLISFISALLLLFVTVGVSNAVTDTVTTVTTVVKHNNYHHKYCGCYRHKRHFRDSYRVESYYSPGYCVGDPNSCGGVVCYPDYYFRCWTEYYYRAGRNSARVEVCD